MRPYCADSFRSRTGCSDYLPISQYSQLSRESSEIADEEGKEGIADTMSSIDYRHARLEEQLQILVNRAREWELVDHQSFRVLVDAPIRMISTPGRLLRWYKVFVQISRWIPQADR